MVESSVGFCCVYGSIFCIWLFVWEAWHNNIIGSVNVSVSDVGPIYLTEQKSLENLFEYRFKITLAIQYGNNGGTGTIHL